MERDVSSDHRAELDRHLAWLEGKMPLRFAKFMGWVGKPSSRLDRVPLAMALIIGGIFSFLPVLGLWMLPLGLILIAQDLPFLQGPMAPGAGVDRAQMVGAKSRETHFVRA